MWIKIYTSKLKLEKNNSNSEGAILPTVELSLRSYLMLRYKYICVEYIDVSTKNFLVKLLIS